MFWKSDVHLSKIKSTDKFIQTEMTHPSLASAIMITFVYASCDARKRKNMWNDLSATTCSCPWMVVGDFNVVANQDEKLRGCPINLNDVAELNAMIEHASLIDVGFSVSKFTWSNNRLRTASISERLNRTMLLMNG